MTTESNDARQTADAVFARDRQRIRLLASLTIFLWVAAFFIVPSVYLPFGAKVKEHVTSLKNHPASAAPLTSQEVADQLAPLIGMGWFVGAVMMGMVLFTEVLAAISTVALVLTIRRVTLRQLTTGLADISEQLRQLQRSSGGLQ